MEKFLHRKVLPINKTKKKKKKKKKNPTEWEKIFVNEATDKGFISKIYK